ncbi:IniB N-terminal domain-containing protein [Pseudonocardia alaniniphila]|uniref:IniB N-terminal domain-containing protein n=1 Tax=Pseudonocardia alaniniphila TaxID=75291 RepID=A0ABS9T6Q4_9PSEU|nr:IniB N-terminal domain-containing protein [Pseudonocardia alaniniphila]MCH6164212.1 IniB N-terminal domain-containing protein [Pseudonocardia alaniniphila]
MTTSTSLLDLLLDLLRDPEAKATFNDDPDGYLATCGALSAADVRDAIVLLQDEQEADLDREYAAGASHLGGQGHIATPPPAPQKHDGESDHEAAVRYLNTYVTNNYVDNRDTVIDNSVNQQIDTGGGDFDQDIDIDSTAATGDGAVAAGGNIQDSKVVTGDGNQVGQGNLSGDDNLVGDGNDAVSGDDNTIAFGNGDADRSAMKDVGVDHGGALSVGDTATGDYDANGSFNDVDASTRNSTEFDGSFTTTDDAASSSFNEADSDVDIDSHDTTHTDFQSHNDLGIDS